MNQVLWLNDGRAIDFLIDLLADKDGDSWFWKGVQRVWRIPLLGKLVHSIWMSNRKAGMKGSFALALLNQLEFGRMIPVTPANSPSQPSYYRRRQNDPAFREAMIAAVHKWNAETKNGS
jgi:hypothetical protein